MRSRSSKPSAEKTVRIVARAASVLECFSPEQSTLSLSDLSARLSLPKPTAFRIATVLLRLGLLEQVPSSGAYTLGFAGLHYAESLLASISLRGLALPVMENLRDEINETIILSLRDGDFRYNIDSVEGTHAIGQTQQIGAPIPLYAGAASRVMLAAMAPLELEDYLQRVELTAFSPTTITDMAELRAKIEHARENGFVATSGEFTSGGHAVACLIQTPKAFGVAALHVSIPHARYTKALVRRSITCLRDGIRKISETLDHSGAEQNNSALVRKRSEPPASRSEKSKIGILAGVPKI
jgi:DNA-binding IclR family transcriptional regulator